MITVHHLNDSRSQRVLWLLEEMGLPYEVKRYQRDAKTMLAPPELRIVTPPAKGELSFRSGQSTSIATATNPKCVGSSVSGTGLYYTAAANAEGSDRFTVEARLQGGAVSSRVFEVRIER